MSNKQIITWLFQEATRSGKYRLTMLRPSNENSRKQFVAPMALQLHIRNRFIGNENKKPKVIFVESKMVEVRRLRLEFE